MGMIITVTNELCSGNYAHHHEFAFLRGFLERMNKFHLRNLFILSLFVIFL